MKSYRRHRQPRLRLEFANIIDPHFFCYKFVNFPGVKCLILVNHIDTSVLPRRVWFLRRFGLKTVIDFVRFGLQSAMVRGNYGIECMSAFAVSILNE